MGDFRMLSENLLNLRTFPDHTLAANEETVGNEVEFVQSGRRQKSLNHWTPTTENSEATITLTMDRVRAFDFIAIDRGHNLDAEGFRVRASSDAFTTFTEVAYTLPSNVYAFSPLDAQNGVKTPEGAWLIKIDTLHGSAIRFVFDAMGAGLKPEVVGLYCGLSYGPTHALIKPFTFGLRELDYNITRSPSAWAGAGQISQRRVADFSLRLADRTEYAQGVYHVEELFLRAKPTWIVMDDGEAEKAYLSRAEPGTSGFTIQGDWPEFQGTFRAPEHEPKPL